MHLFKEGKRGYLPRGQPTNWRTKYQRSSPTVVKVPSHKLGFPVGNEETETPLLEGKNKILQRVGHD